MIAVRHTTAEHEAFKRDEARWQSFRYVGKQRDEHEDGTVEWLECRDCVCGSTLARSLGVEP